MLDIKLIRENPDAVRTGLTNRGGRSLPDLEAVIAKDRIWRDIVTSLERVRSQRNAAADEIAKLKREKKDAAPLIASMESVKAEIKGLEERERVAREEVDALLLSIPNLPDESVPLGKGPDDNKVVREHGTKRSFPFKPKDHHEVGVSLGILDFDAGAKLSGA